MGRGGLARGIQDPILSGTSLIRPTSPHALLFPVFHQGKSLGEGVSRSSPQTSHRTGSSDSRLLQSPIRGPEELWVLATHQSIVALLPWQCCLSTCQQAYSRHQAIGPALVMTISSLLGCGLVPSQRPSDISCQAREQLLQLCQELRLQVNAESHP